eukprot:TRINITY_DN2948_c0_g1_i1.p1 TRINITY_DN2948_c0_g1~~TRINITY_DN2948_c0_g1_i1.p1  ORF type:complete len:272 (-),score=72.20 TRINITY_DN2948_c0_g1_i1:207-1022(-)
MEEYYDDVFQSEAPIKEKKTMKRIDPKLLFQMNPIQSIPATKEPQVVNEEYFKFSKEQYGEVPEESVIDLTSEAKPLSADAPEFKRRTQTRRGSKGPKRQAGRRGPPIFVGVKVPITSNILINPHQDLIVCDIDGTAADVKARREMKDKEPDKKKKWRAFNNLIGQEPINPPVFACVHAMAQQGYKILYLSGRSSEFVGKTINWLNTRGFPRGELRMRAERDFRKDNVVKTELMTNAERKRTLMALDDRDQVVEMWRGHKVPCFQVAPGNF